MQLPAKPYDNYRIKAAKANKFGFIKLNKNTYTIYPKVAGQKVWIKIRYDTIEILDNNYQTIVTHHRLYGKGKKATNWLPYVKEIMKKPRAIEYTEFFHQLPKAWQVYIKEKIHRKR